MEMIYTNVDPRRKVWLGQKQEGSKESNVTTIERWQIVKVCDPIK